MQASVFYGPEKIEVEDVDKPEINQREVLIEVGANTICGTDLRILRGEKTRHVKIPTILGHEIAGRIAEVGENVRGYEVGTLVAVFPGIPCLHCYYCRHGLENACINLRALGYQEAGGLSEYVRIPADAVNVGVLFAPHKELPPEYLSLAEPLSCCIYGQRRTRVGVDDTVLVMGAGPIGLFHLQLALVAGARTVIVSEPSASRRKTAERLGAHRTVDPTNEDLSEAVAENTEELGVDAAIICIGLPSLVNEALKLTRAGGRINVFAGLAGKGWSEVEANLIHYNNLELIGNTGTRRSDFEMALRLIETGRVKVEEIVTHRFPLSSTVNAFEAATSANGLKVAVMPNLAEAKVASV